MISSVRLLAHTCAYCHDELSQFYLAVESKHLIFVKNIRSYARNAQLANAYATVLFSEEKMTEYFSS